MKYSHRWLVASLPLALLSTGAIAKQHAVTSESEARKTLESKLPSTLGFQVEHMVITDDGVACINYRVANGNGGESHEHAVVRGDDVLRSTPGNSQFEKAWNRKCAKAD
jgi:hypothetical protein